MKQTKERKLLKTDMKHKHYDNSSITPDQMLTVKLTVMQLEWNQRLGQVRVHPRMLTLVPHDFGRNR